MSPVVPEAERAGQLRALSALELDRYRSAGDRAEAFLAGRMLLRALAAELTGVAAADIRIAARCPDCGGPHGRPVIEGSRLHVGLAHCPTAVVAAASWDGPIGIDVEQSPGSPEAVAAIGALTGLADLRHWTRVEAVLKADGRGLRVDPAAVSVNESARGVEGAIAGSSARYLLTEPRLPGGLLATVATPVGGEP
ncbi:hypothetical protein BH11ACT4_BH11ACT4_21930 [soil metagenome]